MNAASNPTERELEILKILWERGEASVRDVYERMRETAPIVQNTWGDALYFVFNDITAAGVLAITGAGVTLTVTAGGSHQLAVGARRGELSRAQCGHDQRPSTKVRDSLPVPQLNRIVYSRDV